MKTRRILSAFSALAAAAVSVSAVSVCSYAALLEGSAENPVGLEMASDPYIDYTKVNAVEAVITVTGGYANGAVGVNTLDGVWTTTQWESGAGGSTEIVRIFGLDGIFAPDEGKGAAIYVQFWNVDDGVSYTVDSVTIYDADGKEILPQDEPVTRPDLKFADAEPLDIDNDSFSYPGQIDIAQAVGEDFGNIAKMTATFKWGEGGWNGTATLTGLTLEDGTPVGWADCGEIGNLNDFSFLDEQDIHEYTFDLFDYTDTPITELKSIGSTGEISGYATLSLVLWGAYTDGEYPAVSNISFYNKDGELLASLDYETAFDNVDVTTDESGESTEDTTSDVTSETENTDNTDNTEADTTGNSGDKSDTKGSPDTGVAGIAAAAGIAVIAGGAAVLSRKRK